MGKRFVRHYGRKFENFSILGVDFLSQAFRKGLDVLAIFRCVVKIEVFSEGKTRKKFSASGFAFERLTFLSKVEDRLKRGENSCEKFTRGDILNFKKCLDDGNLWFLPFSFQWLFGHTI